MANTEKCSYAEAFQKLNKRTPTRRERVGAVAKTIWRNPSYLEKPIIGILAVAGATKGLHTWFDPYLYPQHNSAINGTTVEKVIVDVILSATTIGPAIFVIPTFRDRSLENAQKRDQEIRKEAPPGVLVPHKVSGSVKEAWETGVASNKTHVFIRGNIRRRPTHI